MKSPTMRSTLAASLLLASGLPALVSAEMLFIGCYNTAKGMDDQGKYTYQSSGYCQNTCLDQQKPVFALWKGSNCLCGDALPPNSDKVAKNQCNIACDGWPQDMCGGANTYSFYLVDAADAAKVPTRAGGSSPTTTKGTHGGTATGGQSATDNPTSGDGWRSIIVTSTSEPQGALQGESNSNSDKSNTAAIAAGVVVGVVGFSALLGAIFFVWRFKKRRSQGNYHNTGPVEHYSKPMSTSSNSRFDGDFMAQRRQSNGSIDDDQDFSRRILQVTNPDR